MDMKMKAEDITTAGTSWDVKTSKGIVPIISGDEESLQIATQAGFLIKGSIPQLPDAGVPWTEFLTNKMSFGELDYYVRDSLQKAGKETFYPQYDIENDKLTMSIGQKSQEADYNEL